MPQRARKEAPPHTADWELQFAQALAEQRQRVSEFVVDRQGELDQIEAKLLEQLARISAGVASERSRHDDGAHALETRQAELAAEARQLAELRVALETRQAEFAALQTAEQERLAAAAASLAARQGEICEREGQLTLAARDVAAQRRILTAEREELDAEREEINSQRRRWAEKHAQLEADQEQCAGRASETKLQRRRVAKALLAQRAAQAAECLAAQQAAEETRRALADEHERLAQRQSELTADRALVARERDDLAALRSELEADFDRLAEFETEIVALAAGHSPPAAGPPDDAASQQLVAQAQRLHELEQALLAAREAIQQLGGQLREEQRRAAETTGDATQARHALAALEAELQAMRQGHETACLDPLRDPNHDQVGTQFAEVEAERDQLLERLSVTERQLADALAETSGDDYRRRYELALGDLRDQKGKIAELERLLAAARRQVPTASQGDGQDWESQKRRLLAALEADLDPSDDNQRRQRITIEDALERTDEALAAKDRELDQLRQQLTAGGVAAAEVDLDLRVRQERDKLHLLQVQWQEKLCQAEVELSQERAKIARERSTIEERLRAIDEEQARRAYVASGTSANGGKKATRGRWLARLGLKDDEDTRTG